MTKIVLLTSFMLFLFSPGVFGQACADPTFVTEFVESLSGNYRVSDEISGCVEIELNQETNFFASAVQGEPGGEGTIAQFIITNSDNTEVGRVTVNSDGSSNNFFFVNPGTFTITGRFLGGIGTFQLNVYTTLGPAFTDGFRFASQEVSVQQALPVTWIKPLTYAPFGNEVQLNWSVTDQVDVAGYELERDSGNGFTTVASISYQPGEGEINYFARQPQMTEGVYYRVKQLDYAGTFDYTNVVFVPGSASVLALSAFPNPAKDFVRMTVPQEVREIQLLSSTGQVMGNYTADQARTGIDLSKLVSGLYFLRSRDGNSSVPQRLVVRR